MTTYAEAHSARFARTLEFMEKHLPPPAKILDLGIRNPFSQTMEDAGYQVQNTGGEDLDLHWEVVKGNEFDAVTAFEIVEHLVNPFMVLKDIQAENLFITVPLRLWFSKAYWNENDPFDRHYHEFEPKQLFMLLEKAGWTIVKADYWKPPFQFKLGLRPLLRSVTPRHIAVYCQRINR
ncbi:MAG: hypothetical protein R2806_24870 [Saprospiraceae bacterium]